MRLKHSKYLFNLVIVLLIATQFFGYDCKRSRGRSRGSSSTSNWSRAKTQGTQTHSQSNYDNGASLSYANYNSKKAETPSKVVAAPKPVSAPKPAPAPKPAQAAAPKPSAPESKPVPSAPVSETVNKQSVGFQQSAPTNQRPIGWNVGSNQPSHGTGTQQIHSSNYPQTHSSYPTQNFGNSYQNGYPNGYSGAVGSHGSYSGYPNGYNNYHGASYPSAYPNTGAGQYYGTGTNYGSYGSYDPHQPFKGYHPTSNIGVIPPSNANAGHYYNSISGMGGLGNSPMFMGGHNTGGGGGLFGSLFGGKKQGYGGYGGYGGYSGFGGYGGYPGYGMGYHKKSGGLFGKNAFRNVLAGVFIYSLLRGAVSTPYHVYNYYHRPEGITDNMQIPANTIMLCNENATELCAPGTLPLCTTNNTIFCVTTAAHTVPCGEDLSVPCVNSTIPCLGQDDPMCKDNTSVSEKNMTTIALPCISNMTIEGNLNVNVLKNDTNLSNDQTYCITTVAIPQPVELNQNITTPCVSNTTNSDGNNTCLQKNTSEPPSITTIPPVILNDTTVTT